MDEIFYASLTELFCWNLLMISFLPADLTYLFIPLQQQLCWSLKNFNSNKMFILNKIYLIKMYDGD